MCGLVLLFGVCLIVPSYKSIKCGIVWGLWNLLLGADDVRAYAISVGLFVVRACGARMGLVLSRGWCNRLFFITDFSAETQTKRKREAM